MKKYSSEMHQYELTDLVHTTIQEVVNIFSCLFGHQNGSQFSHRKYKTVPQKIFLPIFTQELFRVTIYERVTFFAKYCLPIFTQEL